MIYVESRFFKILRLRVKFAFSLSGAEVSILARAP
jgi:hypothetical protein